MTQEKDGDGGAKVHSAGSDNTMQDLKRNTIRGGLAILLVLGTGFLLRLGSLMVLARLLDPKNFRIGG
jgi:hypothetical protein